MSSKECAVCGKALTSDEIRLNERKIRSAARKSRYLCSTCRQEEYNQYVSSMKKIIDNMR